MWDYVLLLGKIYDQDEKDLNGIEKNIKSMLDRQEINWIPISRSLVFEKEDTDLEENLDTKNLKKSTKEA